MLAEIKTVQTQADLLHSQQEVEAAIIKLAEQINHALADKNPLLLCVINGGIVFAGQLLTRLTMPLNLDSIQATRYRNETSGGQIEWLLTPKTPLLNRTVLILDDVLDEGVTLAAVQAYCREQGACEVYSAVLIEKLLPEPKPASADFIGIVTENRYLFGYGMDYKSYLRNANGIYACS